ncbi:Fe-S biogenesis protein NfuA [secondary endosymbiont of Heteropsylla cubana]|nr:Fe-S biogenesis protein NfuA [secondary endosymbiont of Heteropsylla cubana]
MIYISDAAQKHFIRLLSHQKFGTQIRVFVINPGTSNAECAVSYCFPNTIEDTDLKLEFDNITVYVDKLSAPYLQDAEIDFLVDKFDSQLTLKAPNAKKRKLIDEIQLIDQVKYFLESKINPELAIHGGQVTLVEITSDMFVVLQFGGGCNGCSMVDYTLKDGIEKEMLATFPKLKGVKDITKHQRNQHSYY